MATHLSILNDPPRHLEGPQLLHQLIRWKDYPANCAIDCTSGKKRTRYTYKEVQSSVSKLVTKIQYELCESKPSSDEIPKQHIVPILLPQCPGLYISQLAILNSGGAFCPIVLDSPQERVKFMVRDVEAKLIITTSALKKVASWENGPKVILVDEFPALEEEYARTPDPPYEAKPDDLAYVMYTSGSTGKPKGVAVSHLAASQSLLAHERYIPQFKRFLQFAAPSFDVSVFEIFFPLTRGCTLVGCSRTQLLNDLPGMITKLDVDAAELTPTVVGSLLQRRSNAPGLKLLLTIGEPLTTPIVQEFGGSDTQSNMLYGMYGPTEAAIHCTIYPMMAATTKPGNIGIPFDTVSTFIAAASTPDDSANLHFLPLGEIGELVLGGPQVAQGYLNRPEQNKAAFVTFEGRKYYRTGDKAKQLEDGTIEIFGRISGGQVKLRGQRIELGEIEEAVYKHPSVRTAVAMVFANALLVFALIGAESVDAEDVIETCSQWLPRYMVPSEIMLLQEFPYLPSGKVDKRKLEADYQQRRELDEGESSAGASKIEMTVATILREVLGSFSRSTRLAVAGLDSLVAIRVASRLRAAGFNVNTFGVLQAENLKTLVQLCGDCTSIDASNPTKSKSAPQNSPVLALNGHATEVEYTLPCTPLQLAMLSETSQDRTAYRNWVELDLPGITELEQVAAALQTLASMNPIMRTGFAESQDSNGFAQIIWKNFPDARIEEVQHLKYEFDEKMDLSLQYPVRFQILKGSTSAKVLMHIHHALYDAWSLELLLDDLNSILTEETPRDRPEFSVFANGYADGTLRTDDWPSKDYWRDHLAGLELAQLPTFQTKRTLPNLVIARHHTTMKTSEVEAAARNLSASPQSLFQAAFALLLSAYLGSSDICFGTVFSGRTLPIVGIEDIAGPCLATLPIRVDLTTSATVQDLVQELNSINRKHLEHSTIPLRAIKSSAGVNPRQALFDTLLIWQQTLHPYDHNRKHVSLVDTVDNLEFNLTLEIIPTVGNIELKANYQQSLLPESQVNLLLRQVGQIASLMVRNATLPLASIFSRLDKIFLSVENEKPATKLKGHTLSSPVEKIAAEDPNRLAISFSRSLNAEVTDIQQVSYSQLNTHANRIGHHLLDLGVLPDELVCICMEKCIDLYASILATSKIGAGYLPLPPDVPVERLEHILREAKVKVILAQLCSRSLFKSFQNVKVIYLDDVKREVFPSKNIPPRSSPESVSYCVFTSGSTGTPKGVLVTQGNLLGNLDVLETLYPATKDARFLQSCSQAFDVSVFEIFFTWRIGGCICFATKDVLFQDLENAIRVLEVTHLSLTPTVASLIDPKNVPHVKFLVTAGEAVTPKVFNAWADRGLWQGYGPSETTNICAVNLEVSKGDLINNVGPPFSNTSAFVLAPSDDFQLVPRGGVGEFCFGGAQVFRGYVDQSQNVGKIIDHPEFGRLYRSGDYGRLLPDGCLVFTGRKDDQVKIRGQRVELGEISNVLLRSKIVKDCIAIVLGDAGSQRLVCFWAPAGDAPKELRCLEPDQEVIETLFSSLNAALPAYMIPSALIPISFLPSTTQGKIDKRALANIFFSLEVAYLDSTSQIVAVPSDHEWTAVEKEIAQAVAQVTGLPISDIGAETSFFNLGIDSISAIALSRALQQSGGYQVLISDILKFPSVVRLVERLSSRSQVTPVPAKSVDFCFEATFRESTTKWFKSSGQNIQNILPCTPLQEAMLSAAQASSEKLYDNHVTLLVKGDLKKLQSCWREMVRRHEILRTCFISTDIPRYPFAQVILEDYELQFGSIASLEERKPLPRGHEPPYRLDFLRSDGALKLVVSMHHALYDGEALSILYDEVERYYQQEPLEPAACFAPFLKAMSSIDLEEADKFWVDNLRNCSFQKFKSLPQKPVDNQAPTQIHRITPKLSLNWVESHTKQHSTSLLAVLHTVWATVISERLQETDVCFGNVVSGRTLPVPDLNRLVAPCFNTIPSRLRNIHNLTYLEAFRKLQTVNADSLPHQLTPLRRIQAKLSPDGSRLFDTLFILQQPARELNASIWEIEGDSGAMDFPLVCEVVPKPSDDTIEIMLHSYNSVISADDAMAILASFEEKLSAALENPRRQLLAPAVKEQILITMQEREGDESEQRTEESSPRAMSEDEKKLRDVVKHFTDVPVEKIGRDMSIFRLGLDSISTVQVASRLRKLGHNVLASDILEHATISKLSEFLSKGTDATRREAFDFDAFDKEFREAIFSKHGIAPDAIQAVRPCTAVQQGMIAQTLHSGGKEYMNSMSFELLLGTSLPKFKDAWRAAVTENEMFRTGFASTEHSKSPFVMVTYRQKNFSLPWYENGDDREDLPVSDQLLTRPWSLEIRNVDAKKVIQFTAHHALYDASSIQMLLSDVAAAYSSSQICSRPSTSVLLGEILQQSRESMEEKKKFWSKEENKIVANKFPDLAPLRISDSSNEVRETVSKASLSILEAKCRTSGVTMQAASQVAWARLLASYIGETSTTFGMTLSGRSIHEDAEKISFPSIVTLPVRCSVSGTNAELLARTMQSNALLHKHQFTPLNSIQKWAGYPEGKIFDTLFAYQKFSGTEDDVSPPWKVIKEEASVDYAVSLEVQPSEGDQLVIRLTFRTDLIPVEHAEVILQQYDSLLLDTLENPDHPSDVAPAIGNELLSVTAAEESSLPSPVNLLHEFVELGAREHPDKIALEFATNLEVDKFQSKKWTYRQLNDESNKIANLLVRLGVLPGDIVAVCFDKCPEASFAIIGILNAGCAYVALDPGAPADRVKFIVEDSGAKLVVTAGKPGKMLQELMNERENFVINLDKCCLAVEGTHTKPMLARTVTPGDISYCLYTSGTTGTPKGCLITHRNAVQFMLAFSKLFAGHWTEDSKYLQFASFHFDVSVMEQFWTWSIGICVASAPRDLIFEDLAGAINQLQITHIDLTPSLARTLHPDDVPTLCKGAFVTGGESLRQDILDVWGKKAVIYNGYGPTEATIGCTMYPRVPKNGRPDNIGPAYIIAGSYVLKPGSELPVLRGGVGELCVSGELVGKGYLNRDDLTAERFPTLKAFNERVYRTGDLVRILHDGSFIFLGRADDQIKLRGQRLELSEINEVVKKSTAAVQEVVTQVLKHSAQQKEQLVTFFVADSIDASELVATLRDACKSRLPGYMVPTHFIPVEKVPLNANNKADRKQLAVMYNELSVENLQALGQSSQQDKAWKSTERKVLEKIALAIGVESSSLTRGTTIFELGLDSISIIGFSRSLQEAGLENAKLSVVKNNPSMDGLVKALLSSQTADQGRENAYVAAAQSIAAFSQRHRVAICNELGVESDDVGSISPCTPVQEGMIYRFLESGNAVYFNKFQFRLYGDVDEKKLTEAWNRVVENLEVLRMKFVATDDGFAQVVVKEGALSLGRTATNYDAMDKIAALQMPYSLILKSRILTLQMFHGLYDGNSLTMLLSLVVEEYHARPSLDYGPPFSSSLPYGPLAVIPGAQDFWTEHLSQWTPSSLPSRLESKQDIIANRSISDLNSLEALGKRLGVTPQALVQAAWLSVLQSMTSSTLTIGIVTSGRAIEFSGAEKVVGPLFNTIPLHTRLENGMTSTNLVKKCHEFNMQMQDFQHTPLKEIQKWSPAKAGQGLFDSLFVFQRPEVGEEDFAKDLWTQIEGGMEADYPLAFEATLSPDGRKLSMVLVAQGSVISRLDADRLLSQMEESLQAMLESSGKNVISGTTSKSSQITLNGATENSRASSSITNGPFTWTEEAVTIKSEIALLAKISEDTVDEHSSIFELGLDSIDVIKLSSRLKRRGIQIPVSVIIKSQTIYSMSSQISSKVNGTVPQTKNSLPKMSADIAKYLQKTNCRPDFMECVLPATPLQQTMVNEMRKSGFKRYFNIDVFEVSTDVDLGELVDALETVIAASPILRTTFVEIDDPKLPVRFAQIQHAMTRFKWKVLRNMNLKLGEDDRLEELIESIRPKITTMAEKDNNLMQYHCITRDEEKWLVIAISHALYDGTSLRSFHEDVRRAYEGQLFPRPDFNPFLEQVFQSTTEEAKKYWRTTLSNLPSATFPRKDTSKFDEATTVCRLEKRSQVSLKAVEALCKSSRITLQTLGQTCWSLVLSQLMGQLDVVFGSVLSCRDSEDANEVMFPLMNTVAVRSVLHGTLGEMLRYMQEMSDTTRQYQHFPLGTAQAYALASRETKDTTLFDTIFIYQGRRQPNTGKQLYKSVYDSSDVEYPVCVEMEIVDDEYIQWTTACKSFARDEAETEGLLGALEAVLERIVSNTGAQTMVTREAGISICGLPTLVFKGTQPKKSTAQETDDFDEEWSDTELHIRKALQEISGVPEDSITKGTTIFHLGLDSILVLKLPALLKTYGVKLSVSNILKEQTVVAMAQAFQETKLQVNGTLDVDAVLSEATLPPGTKNVIDELEWHGGKVQYVMPATAGQTYMIRQWQASRGAKFYQTFSWSEVSLKARLEDAWAELRARHDILRTGFVEVESQILQVVYAWPDDHNEVIVYSENNKETRKSKPDLRLPPVQLVIDDGEEPALKLIIHHALYDGISLPILMNELQALSRAEQPSTSLLSFTPFVAHSISPLTSVAQDKWKSYLKKSTLFSSGRSYDNNLQRSEVYHPSNKISNIKRQAQEVGLGVDALILASIAQAQARKLQQSQSSLGHVILGVYLANRAPFGENLSNLAAPTLNLLPLCVDTPLSRPAQDIARDIQADLQKISSADMVYTNLAQIYEWTGVRVDCFVNILRSLNPSDMGKGNGWKAVQDLGKRAAVLEENSNPGMDAVEDGKCDAYLPSIDIELRYDGAESIDMGVFAPNSMLTVAEAEDMISAVVCSWS